MIKIDWGEFFHRRVILGFYVNRTTHLELGEMVKRSYKLRWGWHFTVNNQKNKTWHRCFIWREYD